MCNVSQIMDQYRPFIPDPSVWPQMQVIIDNTPPEPRKVIDLTIDELYELLGSFRQAVEAAETFDRLTGQPDCVDPEKATLEDRVAALEQKIEELSN